MHNQTVAFGRHVVRIGWLHISTQRMSRSPGTGMADLSARKGAFRLHRRCWRSKRTPTTPTRASTSADLDETPPTRAQTSDKRLKQIR